MYSPTLAVLTFPAYQGYVAIMMISAVLVNLASAPQMSMLRPYFDDVHFNRLFYIAVEYLLLVI